MSGEAERKRQMANMIAAHPGLAPSDVIAIGYQIADFLKNVVGDAGEAVDWGCGMGEFDCWVKVGGVRHMVTVKQAAQQ